MRMCAGGARSFAVMRWKLVGAMCAVSCAVWGQRPPMWDPPDAGRGGMGQWAATPVSTRWVSCRIADGWSAWQGQTPLRRSSCWALHASTAQSGPRWSSASVQVVYEQALAPGWESRLALGGGREAWPEVRRVDWSPEAAWSLCHRSGDWIAGGWCHWRPGRSMRIPVTGLWAAGTWGDWSATGLLLSTGAFGAWASRVVHPRWTVQVGWRSDPMRFMVGVQGRWGAVSRWSWGCEQAGWGGANWNGHVEVR